MDSNRIILNGKIYKVLFNKLRHLSLSIVSLLHLVVDRWLVLKRGLDF